jgi:type 1 glutamine amidotransferase
MAPRLLVHTRTTGYRHASIPAGAAALAELAEGAGLRAEHTEDPGAFRARSLRDCAAVVFLSTSGEVLDPEGREALTGFVASGGGYLGVHGASTTEYDWPYYGELVGARFDGHPEIQPAVVTVEDADHPATAHLPARWEWTDECYGFRANPRGAVRVLAGVDESTYRGGGMGADHPLVWCHERCGGRALYTALGHAAESYAEPAFREHLRGALRWVTRLAN